MVICDMSVPGCPLAHLNTAFSDLTGYQKDKIGTNCKFLQVRSLSVEYMLNFFYVYHLQGFLFSRYYISEIQLFTSDNFIRTFHLNLIDLLNRFLFVSLSPRPW